MLNPALFADLCVVVGLVLVLTETADCWPYGNDNSRRHALPEAVVFAFFYEQLRDGVVLSLERMDRILAIDPANRVMVAEPGVTNQAVQDAAAQHGFFWPPDPTSAAFCSVGGNLAYNSAGPRAVKYGTPRENTLGLRAVTGAGAEIRTGVYTTKGVVGYDLTRLLIGSEGTLAVITEATLKLTPLPEARRTMQAVYRDMQGAARAVSRIMAQPVTPCALEFIDGRAIEMVRNYAQLALPQAAGASSRRPCSTSCAISSRRSIPKGYSTLKNYCLRVRSRYLFALASSMHRELRACRRIKEVITCSLASWHIYSEVGKKGTILSFRLPSENR